jgi:hypothetical protein
MRLRSRLVTGAREHEREDLVEALREASGHDAAELDDDLVARVRAWNWSLAISGREIRTTWAEGFVKGSLEATPAGYSPEGAGRAWYLFSHRAQVQPFGGSEELIPMDLTGGEVFDLAVGAQVAEITVDPGRRPFVLRRALLEKLGTGR